MTPKRRRSFRPAVNPYGEIVTHRCAKCGIRCATYRGAQPPRRKMRRVDGQMLCVRCAPKGEARR